jgi:hypothetical protein
MLQIVEGAECNGALADIERDILLNELREAYTELKFSEVEGAHVEPKVEAPAEPVVPVAPVVPVEEAEENEEVEENEVEVELIFDESEEEPEEEVVYVAPLDEEQEDEPVTEEPAEEEPIAEEPIAEEPVVIAEPAVEAVAEEPVVEVTIVEEEHHSEPTPSAVQPLYDNGPAPIIGEQFQEGPSLGDTIVCPKGLAESAPVASLHSAIGLADKFLLIHELFGDDGEAYDAAIDALEEQPSFEDCLIYISEHYAWSPHSEATKLIMELLQRKYNA